jgi:hypothetical protein
VTPPPCPATSSTGNFDTLDKLRVAASTCCINHQSRRRLSVLPHLSVWVTAWHSRVMVNSTTAKLLAAEVVLGQA